MESDIKQIINEMFIGFIEEYGNNCELVGYYSGLEENDPLRIKVERSRDKSLEKIKKYTNGR